MRSSTLAVSLALLLACFVGASAAAPRQDTQNQKKSKKQQTSQPADSDPVDALSPANMPDPQAIDMDVSQMLGAWQIGDVDMMHKYYADDVVVISGVWEPPLIGWDNFVKAYQAQRARTQSAHLDRINSYTKVQGTSAWVTYQWRFTGEVDGQSLAVFGHTTLYLEKRNGAWLITLNHTSTVPSAASEPPAQTSSSAAGAR